MSDPIDPTNAPQLTAGTSTALAKAEPVTLATFMPGEIWADLPDGDRTYVAELYAATDEDLDRSVALAKERLEFLELRMPMVNPDELHEAKCKYSDAIARRNSTKLEKTMWRIQYETSTRQRNADKIEAERIRRSDLAKIASRRRRDLAIADTNLALAERSANASANSAKAAYIGVVVSVVAVIVAFLSAIR